MSSEIAVEVVGLSKKYQLGSSTDLTLRGAMSRIFERKKKTDFWALDDVSFSVTKGDAIGIVGRNGAGKSTLLKVLSRITAPSRGRIVLNGGVTSLLEVGTGFHPELTGRENIFLNGTLLGMSKTDVNMSFDSIVTFAELEAFIDTPVKKYSSGMYTRLAFAVAAHLQSDILIIDEVLAVGDIDFQKKCIGKIDSIKQSGRTVLFVSHNLDHIKSLCSNAVYLEKGKLMAYDKVDTILDLYSGSSFSSRDFFSGPLADSFTSFSFYFNDQEVSSGSLMSVKPSEQIEILVKCSGSLKRIKFYLSVFCGAGTKLFTIDSQKFIIINQSYEQIFLIPAMLLRPGAFKVAFGGLVDDDPTSDWLWNEQVFTFHVEPVWSATMSSLNEGLINLKYDS